MPPMFIRKPGQYWKENSQWYIALEDIYCELLQKEFYLYNNPHKFVIIGNTKPTPYNKEDMVQTVLNLRR